MGEVPNYLMLGQRRKAPRIPSTASKLAKIGRIMGISLIALGALAPIAAADDWPYEDLNAVGYDALDVFGDLSNGATYIAGSNVTINATARSDFEDAVVIDVYAPGNDTPIGSKEFGPMPGTTQQFDVQLSPDAIEGLYRIDANGIPTDHFTVTGPVPPIPEFPTGALFGLGVITMLAYMGFQNLRSRH